MERGLRTLDPRLDLGQLGSEAILALGPHIVGAGVWRLVVSPSLNSWGEFKAEVESRFGVSDARRERQFAEMAPYAGEADHLFVLRAEDARRELDASEREAFSYFFGRLSPSFKQELEWLRKAWR